MKAASQKEAASATRRDKCGYGREKNGAERLLLQASWMRRLRYKLDTGGFSRKLDGGAAVTRMMEDPAADQEAGNL